MSEERTAVDVGRDMGDLLILWQPDMDGEQVASAIMSALEHYSSDREGPRGYCQVIAGSGKSATRSGRMISLTSVISV